MTVTTVTPKASRRAYAPPLPADLEALLRRLRLPHIRAHAPEVVATAKAQRWEPAEVLKALLRRGGRRPGTLRAGHPPGRGRVPDREDLRRLAARSLLDPGTHPAGPTHPGMGPPPREPRRLRALRDRQDVPARSPRPAGRRARAARSPGSPSKTSACCCAATAPTTPSPRPSPGSCAPTSSSSTTSGCSPSAADAAEGLYRLVDAAYEKRSIAISSNLHPSGFDELMPKTLATATVDRLLHHAHVCQTSGDSVRLTQALAGQGVSPLT
jgi:hypothetical protein